MSKKYDAVVVGSGPNGLAAAIRLAQAGLSVLLIEGKSTIGGGMRSAPLTLPGFTHDICSAIHPLGMGSPFFSSLPLEKYGLEWIQPPVPLAHPFQGGECVLLDRSIEETCLYLGGDRKAYQRLMQPLVAEWNLVAPDILAPLHFPRHPLALIRFGRDGIRSAEGLARKFFQGREARALFAGLAAHAILPLDKWGTAAFGLVLGILAHAVGWPFPRGGTQRLADALASYFRSLGGEIVTGTMISSLNELPSARLVMLDVTPKQFLHMAEGRLSSSYEKRLQRYRYGPGVFKMDWALSQPIPWKAVGCLEAGTVHLGGTLEEIAACERLVWEGEIPSKSFIIVAQPSLFDPTRAPSGKQTVWAYCHVPNGSDLNLTDHMESQIERYAPGFRDCILARHAFSAQGLECYNPNYVGGDINGGAADLSQLFTRPVASLDPYVTSLKGVFLCSSSTPPGGGVHGMCGFHAAESALKRM